jgi:energy-coupling factor transporter transmembrane protein EcfT
MIDKIIVFFITALAVVFFATIIALPTVIAFFINRWLTKKGIKYVGLFLLIIAPIWTAYGVYTAIYPTDNFYLSEFKEVTLREAPKSATVINKDASYPDFHGDYCSASLLTVSNDDYSSLLSELTNDKRITKNKPGEIIGSSELDKVMGNFKTEQIIYSFTRNIPGQEDHYLFIGFLEDKKTIVVSVCVS